MVSIKNSYTADVSEAAADCTNVGMPIEWERINPPIHLQKDLKSTGKTLPLWNQVKSNRRTAITELDGDCYNKIRLKRTDWESAITILDENKRTIQVL